MIRRRQLALEAGCSARNRSPTAEGVKAQLLPGRLRVIVTAPMCAGRAVDGASSRTSVARTTSMLTKSLLQCRACRLTWFPDGGAGAACPACGGTRIGGTLELFHVGIALIALGGIGWWLRHGPFSDSTGAAVPAVIQAKEVTANVERGPSQGQPVTLRRGEGVTVVKREDRRVLVRDRRGNQVYVSSKKIKTAKVKRRQKKVAKTRSKHVQR